MKYKGPPYDAYLAWVEKLKQLRLSLGLTQEDVAQRIRYSRTRYSAIEKGQSIINFIHLYNLAEAFGVSMPDLLALRVPKRAAKRPKGA